MISARQFVIQQVEKLAVQGWVACKTLVEAVRDLDYEFLFARIQPAVLSLWPG